ncbi:MAG: 1,4-dihydroxy-6-naphthoate synthase [Rikenellaceae bacterium]
MRLNISPCPNDTFMFDAMVNGRIDTEGLDIEVSYLDIEELNRAAIAGEAEFSKISCAILPIINDRYSISTAGAALGRGNGPLFIKRRGFVGEVSRVAIPGLHTTANMLIGRLFPEVVDRTPLLFSQIAEAVERGEYDGGVLIHEGRFTYAERNLELIADLGLLWEQQTSLPLPLGVIAMRNDLDVEIKERFQRVLRRSIEYAFAHPAASRSYIKEHAQEMDDEVIDAHIALFVNGYSLELGDEGARAISYISR